MRAGDSPLHQRRSLIRAMAGYLRRAVDIKGRRFVAVFALSPTRLC
jgi:hypothetical protein